MIVITALAAFLFFLAIPEVAHAVALAIGLGGALLGGGAGMAMGLTGMALFQAASIGWSIGSMIGNMFFGPKLPTVYGPRLQDRTVQSASFGAHVTKLWGSDRLAAEVIFSSEIKEKKHTTSVGGKGMGGGQTSVTYTYSVDIMLAFGRQAKGVARIWADTKLIYDATGATLEKKMAKEGARFVRRAGDESQLPSALEESYHGAGQVSAHRGLFCMEAENFQLDDFGRRIPNFRAEVYTDGEDPVFEAIGSYTYPAAPVSYWLSGGVPYVDAYGEIYSFFFPQADRYWAGTNNRIFHWTPDAPADPIVEPAKTITWSQGIPQAGAARVNSDEPSYAIWSSGNYSLEARTHHLVLAYFNDTSPGPAWITTDAELGSDHQYVAFIAKKGNSFFLVSGNWLYFGADSLHLMSFNSAGAKIGETRALYELAGAGGLVWDLKCSDTFLWALVRGPSFRGLAKIDPETLEIKSRISLDTVPNPVAFDIKSDADIYVFSPSDSGTEFYRVVSEQPPVLEASAVGSSYISVRAFPFWGLHLHNDVLIVDFAGCLGGFQPLIDLFSQTPASDEVALWRIVRDINVMAGLDSPVGDTPPTTGDIDVSELTDRVHGYALTRSLTARESLIQLQQTYFFDARVSGGKLRYPKRGKTPVALLSGDDLAVRAALTDEIQDRLALTRKRESELPLRVHIVFNNWEADYQDGHEYAPRQITEAQSPITIEISIAITSAKARRVADALLALAWLERDAFSLKTSRKWLQLDAADNVEVEITETGEANG